LYFSFGRRLTISTGEICNENGESISPDSSPRLRVQDVNDPTDWVPFHDRLQFETADLLFWNAQISGGNIDEILQLWSASVLEIDPNAAGPFKNHRDLYETIDSITLGDVPWTSASLSYEGPRPESGPVPAWMITETEIWYRDPSQLIHNIIGSPDFHEEIDFVPYHEYIGDREIHRFHDFFSGDWVWKQAVRIL
jgi:hypothetical protein